MNAGTSVQLLSEDNAEAVASARPSWADVVPSCLERSRHGTSVTFVAFRVGLENDDARRLYLRLGYLPTGETSTVSYEYLDDDGQLRTATETDAWMTKGLA